MVSFGTAIILNFGKYKGQSVADVAKKDYKYLSWVVLNIHEIESQILAEIWVQLTVCCSSKLVSMLQRQRAANFSRQSRRNPWEEEKTNTKEAGWEKIRENVEAGNIFYGRKATTKVVGISRSDLDAVVVKWYRESAKKWHPDLCRGSGEPMKAINDCYDRLKQLIAKL